MKKSFTEIYEGWSERDVNLMLLFLEAQSLAGDPDDISFQRTLGRMMAREAMSRTE